MGICVWLCYVCCPRKTWGDKRRELVTDVSPSLTSPSYHQCWGSGWWVISTSPPRSLVYNPWDLILQLQCCDTYIYTWALVILHHVHCVQFWVFSWANLVTKANWSSSIDNGCSSKDKRQADFILSARLRSLVEREGQEVPLGSIDSNRQIDACSEKKERGGFCSLRQDVLLSMRDVCSSMRGWREREVGRMCLLLSVRGACSSREKVGGCAR